VDGGSLLSLTALVTFSCDILTCCCVNYLPATTLLAGRRDSITMAPHNSSKAPVAHSWDPSLVSFINSAKRTRLSSHTHMSLSRNRYAEASKQWVPTQPRVDDVVDVGVRVGGVGGAVDAVDTVAPPPRTARVTAAAADALAGARLEAGLNTARTLSIALSAPRAP